jgi:hypothetical protein
MKKLLFLFVILFSSISVAQWRYSEKGNEFDGKIRAANVIGKGNDYPYNSPKLILNYFIKDDSFNLYIDDSGYFNDGAKVTMIFDKEPNVFYKSYNQSISTDNKTIFIDEFYVNDDVENKIELFEVLEKLKLSNSLSVRVEDDYGKNDIRFTLSGSTKAINFVVGSERLNKKLEEIISKKTINNITLEQNKNIYNKLSSIAEEYKISGINEERFPSTFKIKLKKDLGLYPYDIEDYKGLKYSSLKIKEDFSGYYLIIGNDTVITPDLRVKVFYVLENGEEIEFDGIYEVDEDSFLVKDSDIEVRKR